MTTPGNLPIGAEAIADRATGNELKPNADGSINVGNANPNGQNIMANSSPVVLPSDQSPVPIKQPTSTTGTPTSVTAAAASTQLLAANTSRKAAYVFNESTAIMFLSLFASGTNASYTLQVPANGFYETPTSPVYTGVISAQWSAAQGFARITEMS